MATEKQLKISLAILAPLCLSAGLAAVTTYFDVRDLKERVANGVTSDRITKLEGSQNTHEAAALIRASSVDQRFVSLEARVQSLERSREWQRNREAERR